jgi:serine/threonine protein kinase
MTISIRWLEAHFPDLVSFASIGKGGQKEVFKATRRSGGTVVVKLFHPGSDPGRALREIQAVKSLASDRVPEIYDYGTARSPVGDVIWVSEEYLEGESLRARLQRGPLDAADVMRIGSDILRVLVLAEGAHIVHRDIKPENILLCSANSVAYLLDFGIARHLDLPSMTASSAAAGPNSPGYSPPEQFRNIKRDIDSRADAFALGVTMYEALTGTNPYLAETSDRTEVERRVLARPLPPLPSTTQAPEKLRRLIVAMTRVRRNHRPDTLSECRDWLDEAIAQNGV